MIRFWQRLSRATQQGPDADVRSLVRREFGLRVKRRAVYEEALTHSSMLDGDKTGLKSNERLEFLGDVVLDMTMANYLYKAFPEAQEGELTKEAGLSTGRTSTCWARTWACTTSSMRRCPRGHPRFDGGQCFGSDRRCTWTMAS